jgi:hypothetical protein
MIPLPLDPKLGEGANPRHNELWAQAARVTRDLQDQIALKAPLASPTFTGTVTLPTPFTVGAVSVTATGTELNLLDGVTATTAELNILDGVTATAAEINLLDGITALAASTYSPTVSSVVNASSVTAQTASYTRINNIVSVSGVITMETNTTSLVTMLLTLPVSTTLSGNDLHGSGAVIDAAADLVNPVAVIGNGTSTPRAKMYFRGFTGDPNASPVVYYTFSYRVA